MYKGVFNGEGVWIVWVGDVLIVLIVFGIDSYEQNCNFVFSEGMCVDSILNFEIEIGDIVGVGYVSVIGCFDDEQLFYLQLCGIDEDEVCCLVVFGFFSEIVQKIGELMFEWCLFIVLEIEFGGMI